MKEKSKSLFFTLLLIVLSQYGWAQSAEAQKAYLSGKEAFQNQHYETAEVFFANCLKIKEDNPFQEYASFYFALSAYNSGDKSKAKSMLLQVKERYPTWPQLDEVYFWLFKIEAEQELYFTAFNYLERIKNKSLQKEAMDLRSSFVRKIEEVSTLKRLQETYPQDRVIALTLVNAMARQSATDRDTDLMEKLRVEFKIAPEEVSFSFIPPSVKKDEYKVGVIMPFFFTEVMPYRDDISNPFVFEFVEGMQMARKMLEDQGKKLKFFYYDNENDLEKTKEILSKPELKGMDMLFAPLFPQTSDLVAAFGLENKIITINPLSNHSPATEENPYAYMFKPSLSNMAETAADYAKKTFYNKNAIVYYGTSQRDSILAANYVRFLREDSFQFVWIEKIDAAGSRKILDRLTAKYTDQFQMEVFDIATDSIGHIFVASENEVIAANTISAVEIRGDKIPVFGFENWLQFKFVSYEQLERLGLLMLAPNYVDTSRPELQKFRERYFNATKKMPGDFAFNGFESLYFFGNLLATHGTFFQNELETSSFHKGYLSSGFYFQNSSSNRYVPLVRIYKGTLRNLIPSFGKIDDLETENE